MITAFFRMSVILPEKQTIKEKQESDLKCSKRWLSPKEPEERTDIVHLEHQRY